MTDQGSNETDDGESPTVSEDNLQTNSLSVDSVELMLEFPPHNLVDPIVWTPDEIILVMEHETDSERTITRLSDTSLEGLFHLLNQILADKSDSIPFGTYVLPVIHRKGQVIVDFSTPLSGSRDQWQATVEALISATFAEIQRRGGDTQQIAADLATGRFEREPVDPLAVHDRLGDGG